jgi:protein-glutamine gamma-glutamyltransferase
MLNILGAKFSPRALLTIRAWPESAKSLGALAGVVLLTLLPHVTHLPVWVPLCVVAATGWRLWIEIHAGALPNKWLRSGLALLAMLAVGTNFRTLNGLEAGTALLGMMAGMKLLESRSARDYSILVFIGFFLLFAELLYEQSMMLLPYLLVCTALIITCLLRLHDGGAQLTYGAALTRSTRMLAQALPLAVLLFLFIPRLPGQFWVLPSHGAATTGLSDEMSPGDVSNLSLSNAVAFRVEFQGDPPPAAQRYWRAVVLHDFDGRTWRRQRSESFTPQKIITSNKTYQYRMLMEPSNLQWIPALDIPLQSDLHRSFITSDMQLVTFMPVTKLIAVNVTAATDYQFGEQLSVSLQRIDTRLPGELNPRARALATQLRASSSDDAAYLRAVLTLFREQAFFYTLEPPRLGVHTVDDFLFNTRRGFCEHFSSAFTFLMRAGGIPARVVTGYQGGEINTVSNYLVVRQSDAHAWSEVWLEGRGWVRVDPTAAIAPNRVEQGLDSAIAESETVPGRTLKRSRWLYSLRQNWDAVNTFWKSSIVNFDSADQQAVMNKLGIENADWRKLGIALLVAFISFFLGMMAWLTWRYRPLRAEPAVAAFNQLKRKLAQVGIHCAAHEGPVDFLTRAADALPASATQLRELCDVYVALRYAPTPSAQLVSQLRQLVRQLQV